MDQFAYTNAFTLSQHDCLATGQVWNCAWFCDDLGLFNIDDTNLLAGVIGYPTPYANKLQWVY